MQADQKEIFLQKTGTFGPIMGQKCEITPLESKLPQSDKRSAIDREICFWQLGFNHLIQGTQNIHRISIRATLSPQEKEQVCTYFKKKKKMNFIWLANLTSEKEASDSKDIAKRKKNSTNKHHKMFQLFASVNTKQDIIAYTREDFSGEKNKKSGFTCVVA
jgi:hypothetical protein